MGVHSALHNMGDDLVEAKRVLEAKGHEVQATLERLCKAEKAPDAEKRRYQQNNESSGPCWREKHKKKKVWRQK